MKQSEYKSKVYTDRPAYADFESPHKFQAIQSIIARWLHEYPNAICSYSGGSDSDIVLHMIETVREVFNFAPVQYCFFNTGLEMEAIKCHVRDMEKLYGVTITEHRPKVNIVKATRQCGNPFKVSSKCCDYCKKEVAHQAQKTFDMVITGERRDEGGMRSVPRKDNTSMCFTQAADGKYRL